MGAMAARLAKDEVVIVSGGTDGHIVLEAALERAGLTCNKNGISFDAEKPAVTSGIRLKHAWRHKARFRHR
jgi:glycine hydroxymethyltransferase